LEAPPAQKPADAQGRGVTVPVPHAYEGGQVAQSVGEPAPRVSRYEPAQQAVGACAPTPQYWPTGHR
jgi:hypothetical protein